MKKDIESVTLKRLLRQEFGMAAQIQTAKFYSITRGRGKHGPVLFDIELQKSRDAQRRVFVITTLTAGGRGKGEGYGKETVNKLRTVAVKLGAVELLVDQGVAKYWGDTLGFTRTGDFPYTHGERLVTDA